MKTNLINTKFLSIYICSIALMTLLPSCSEKGDSNVLILGSTVKDTAEVLLPESMDFDIPISANDIYIWNDSIAIVHNRPLEDIWFLELYNLNDGKLMNHFIRRGNGPGEMLDNNFIFYNDTIVITDFQKDHIAIIPVAEATGNNSYTPELKSYSVRSQYILPFKGKLIALNPYCFINKEYGISNDGSRYIVSDSNYVYEEATEYIHDTYNVSFSRFFISYLNDRIVFTDKREPKIEICDTDFNLIKTVLGPDMQGTQKYRIEEDGDVIFVNTIPMVYTSHCYNDEYFYVCYNGDFLSYKNDFDYSALKSWVLKFDWDGNFIDSYYMDHCIKSMSLSNDGRYIYAFGMDPDGESVLYKYLLE